MMTSAETPGDGVTPRSGGFDVNWPRKKSRRSAPAVYVIALALVTAAIAILTIVLPRGGTAAKLLLDLQEEGQGLFVYPWTIQNGMYIILTIAIAQLWLLWKQARHEHALIASHLLPEDEKTVLEISDPALGEIRKQCAELYDEQAGYLPYLIDLSILRFLASKSADQTIAVFNVTVELIGHRVDLRYQSVRYIAWLIPTIGFIGTVVGIAYALAVADPANIQMKPIIDALGISFYTTLVALVQGAIILFLQHAIQGRDELALNRAASYCLKNLISRLYVAPSEQKPLSATPGFSTVSARVSFDGS